MEDLTIMNQANNLVYKLDLEYDKINIISFMSKSRTQDNFYM